MGSLLSTGVRWALETQGPHAAHLRPEEIENANGLQLLPSLATVAAGGQLCGDSQLGVDA